MLLFYADMKSAYGFPTAIRLLVKGVLQSPDFLYRVEFGMPSPTDGGAAPLGAYEMASRLSYLLWNSMPDEELLSLAEAGELSTPEQLATQARRMLEDDRARAAVTNFHRQWLELAKVDALEKDATLYPDSIPPSVPCSAPRRSASSRRSSSRATGCWRRCSAPTSLT